jgi:hypothetical protein
VAGEVADHHVLARGELEVIALRLTRADNYTAKGLTVPSGGEFRVYVKASGKNQESENITSRWAKI